MGQRSKSQRDVTMAKIGKINRGLLDFAHICHRVWSRDIRCTCIQTFKIRCARSRSQHESSSNRQTIALYWCQIVTKVNDLLELTSSWRQIAWCPGVPNLVV